MSRRAQPTARPLGEQRRRLERAPRHVGKEPVDRLFRLELEGVEPQVLEAALLLQRARHERRIDGDDVGAPLEQHPGPAAGRGAEIDADVAGVGRAIEPEEGFGQLHRRARRRRVGHVHAQPSAGGQAGRIACRHDADGDAIARRQQARLRVEPVVGERGTRVRDALFAPRARNVHVRGQVGGALRQRIAFVAVGDPDVERPRLRRAGRGERLADGARDAARSPRPRAPGTPGARTPARPCACAPRRATARRAAAATWRPHTRAPRSSRPRTPAAS